VKVDREIKGGEGGAYQYPKFDHTNQGTKKKNRFENKIIREYQPKN
jgi:hypothetical protein